MQRYDVKERWKPVVGYESEYIVSTYGRVLRLPYTRKNPKHNHTNVYYKIRLKKPFVSNGYLRMPLCKDGVTKKHMVHRLVAEAFISNNENKPAINHIDGDKTNNSVTNLEWVTNSENTIHAYGLGVMLGMSGKKHSLESKEKMRVSTLGVKFTSETKTKMAKAQRQRRRREAENAKI